MGPEASSMLVTPQTAVTGRASANLCHCVAVGASRLWDQLQPMLVQIGPHEIISVVAGATQHRHLFVRSADKFAPVLRTDPCQACSKSTTWRPKLGVF